MNKASGQDVKATSVCLENG